ncbi:L,D-transpeptidase family protein [Candidatus Uhrbacteria bacterium]|nr:L,D-transpeptidase family protein [Candidatus Uhrbacteria bacterium]
MRSLLAGLSLLLLIFVIAVANVLASQPRLSSSTGEKIVLIEKPLPLPGYPGCVARVDQLAPDPLHFDEGDTRLRDDRVIVVSKDERRIMLFSQGTIRRDRHNGAPDCWKVALGYRDDGQDAGVFDKVMQGDRRTPEGWFQTSDKPWSSYHGAIQVHYPGERHAKTALARGSITRLQYDAIALAEKRGTVPPQDTSLGGDILLHADGPGSSYDWTFGCIALNNADIDELRSALPDGMRTWILILP